MFCCTLLYVNSSIAIILMGKRELVALLNLSSWCLVMVERLFLAVPRGCLRFVIVVFPDHTHLLFYIVIFYISLGANRMSYTVALSHFYVYIANPIKHMFKMMDTKVITIYTKNLLICVYACTLKRISKWPLFNFIFLTYRLC